jgi:cobalt/nickel transport system permease protein
LIFTEKNFWEVSSLVIVANIPVMIIEGIVTAFCIAFLKKVSPEMLVGM